MIKNIIIAVNETSESEMLNFCFEFDNFFKNIGYRSIPKNLQIEKNKTTFKSGLKGRAYICEKNEETNLIETKIKMYQIMWNKYIECSSHLINNINLDYRMTLIHELVHIVLDPFLKKNEDPHSDRFWNLYERTKLFDMKNFLNI